MNVQHGLSGSLNRGSSVNFSREKYLRVISARQKSLSVRMTDLIGFMTDKTTLKY